MDKFSYQEPCCIERTLPILLRKYGLLPWQSNGDITTEKIFKAVSHLAGNSLEISLCIATIDIPTLRLIAWYHKRGWLTHLSIITSNDQTELIRAELPAELPVTIASHTSVSDTSPMLLFKGELQTVIVQGPLHALPATTATREQFITYAGKDTDRIAQLSATLTSIFHVATRPKKYSRKRKETEATVLGDSIAEKS